MISGAEWQIVWFTFWVAALSVLLLLPLGLLMGWLLARHNWPGKSLVETVVTLPLIMPPVATGLILLELFSGSGPLGRWMQKIGWEVVFTWRAVLLALMVMSFPLMVRSIRTAIEGVNPRMEQIAATLGASRARILWTITFPLARRGILAGALLAFARALGEFGATIMIAGNIPGRTSTLSLAIYNKVQLGQDAEAFRLLGVSVVLAFSAVWISEWMLRKKQA
ncbi:MAG: molybdate ABC transporter permease subunit [Verrucomicrobiales bacterium]